MSMTFFILYTAYIVHIRLLAFLISVRCDKQRLIHVKRVFIL